MRPENPNENDEMCDRCETPADAFETNVTVLNPTPDQIPEIRRVFSTIEPTRENPLVCNVSDDVPLVSMRLIETARGCETLSGWMGWCLPTAHQVLNAAEATAHGLFEGLELVAVIVTGKPTPGIV
jgi:hypothetical protein